MLMSTFYYKALAIIFALDICTNSSIKALKRFHNKAIFKSIVCRTVQFFLAMGGPDVNMIININYTSE